MTTLRLGLYALLALPLGGCATMALHKSLQDVRWRKDAPVEIRGRFHELREARATLERIRPGTDTLRVWKIAGADLWITEFSEHDRYFLNGSLETAIDSAEGYRSGWIPPRPQPEPWRLVLLADQAGTIPGSLVATNAKTNTLWIHGYRDEKGMWQARSILEWRDSTLAMRPLMNAQITEVDPRSFLHGLYLVTVPLDVAISPFYLLGGIGLLVLCAGSNCMSGIH
jgi:hypothetical protein